MDTNKLKSALERHVKSLDVERDRTPRPWTYTDKQRRTCMSYWFPKIRHLPTPRTVILQTDLLDKDIMDLMDNKKEHRGLEAVAEQLKVIANTRFDYPIFLRTGMTSAKHEWVRTCFVEREDQIYDHMCSIINFSMCCDLYGLPCDVWVIREFLELEADFVGFDGIPIAKEFRFFFKDREVVHAQPYWPLYAFERWAEPSHPNWLELLKDMSDLNSPDVKEAEKLALKVAQLFYDSGDRNSYSVDLCKLKNGEWNITDMAVGEDSFFYKYSPDVFDEWKRGDVHELRCPECNVSLDVESLQKHDMIKCYNCCLSLEYLGTRLVVIEEEKVCD